MPTPSLPGPRRDVGCTLAFNFLEPSLVAFQIAPATDQGAAVSEQFSAIWGVDCIPITVDEVAGSEHGRVHLVEAERGPVTVTYNAALLPPALDPAPAAPPAPGPQVFDNELIAALRQSRYCPSDSLAAFAHTELGGLVGTGSIAEAAAAWVFERIVYQGGASGPTDTAVDTLLSGRGVCRDFAHLTITMCRALGVPARLASVYAPGLAQMDFHAVVEAWDGARWLVLDPTRLAPRQSMVRIATGRDAADTAFAATLRGDVELVYTQVTALVEGMLPEDDHVAARELNLR